MRQVVIEETMSDMDADKDGFVTLDEYLSEFIHLILRHTKHGSWSGNCTSSLHCSACAQHYL